MGVSETNPLYEEGTWTPTLMFDGDSTGITYALQLGRYIKIGNFITYSAVIMLTSKGLQVGDIGISAPISSANAAGGGSYYGYGGMGAGLTYAGMIVIYVYDNPLSGTIIEPNQITEAGFTTVLNNTNISNDATLYLNGSYVI